MWPAARPVGRGINRIEEKMSLPDEKYRALIQAREFMRTLLDPKATPRVPKAVRTQAYYRLKHYPNIYEIELLAERSPDILKKGRL